MKIQQTNAGALTNFEVIDLLRSRGASMDPTRIIGNIAPSELEVYDYLIESASCNQTRQNIGEFLKRCEKYHLAKAEKLNIINIRPFCDALINPIIEDQANRMGDSFTEKIRQLAEMVAEVLPPAPAKPAEMEVEVLPLAEVDVFPHAPAGPVEMDPNAENQEQALLLTD